MNAGKVKAVRVDPGDSTRIEIDFAVQPGDIPVKIDSVAKIAMLWALSSSDNFVEVGTGTKRFSSRSSRKRIEVCRDDRACVISET